MNSAINEQGCFIFLQNFYSIFLKKRAPRFTGGTSFVCAWLSDYLNDLIVLYSGSFFIVYIKQALKKYNLPGITKSPDFKKDWIALLSGYVYCKSKELELQ